MSEERLKILEMLNDNKITADEAAALLKQVQDSDNHSRNDRRDWNRPYYPNKPDLGWINDLRSVIEETASNLGEAVRDAINPNDSIFAPNKETFTAILNESSEIRELAFEGKNAPVKLESYGGDKIEIEAYYKAKGQWNPRFTLCEENGVYSLRYDDNALYMLSLNIRVPESSHIGDVSIKNRNSTITATGITANRIDLNTKNASIKLFNIKGERLICETRNAPITLNAVNVRETDVQTTNAKIILEDVNSFRARLMTSNAKIEVKDSDIVLLYAKTSNSPLRFENMCNNGQEPVYSIDAITTNGQISVQLPHKELFCKLRASTTAGGISNDLVDLEYQANEKNYVEAQTRGYETAYKKTNLNLQTTNSGIHIKL